MFWTEFPFTSLWDLQALDYETKSTYTFSVQVREDTHLKADNFNSAVTSAQVNIWQDIWF